MTATHAAGIQNATSSGFANVASGWRVQSPPGLASLTDRLPSAAVATLIEAGRV